VAAQEEGHRLVADVCRPPLERHRRAVANCATGLELCAWRAWGAGASPLVRDDAVARRRRRIRRPRGRDPTFLIADIRGYTRFTQERGDEAAAQLATKFAEVVREGVEALGGELVELRGDEALAAFGPARQALRAAVEIEHILSEETDADPSLPLGVDVGLEAGEPVPVGEGYRGGALNLAARLCAAAGPGRCWPARR
jgi:class 3 adenylate cyclase